MNKWLDPYEHEPLRFEPILFLVDGDICLGEIRDWEKLRKATWYDEITNADYDCDQTTPDSQRVTAWAPIPSITKKDRE